MHLPSRHAPARTTEFERFLEAVRPKLYSMLAARKVPPEDSDDLVQSSLLALLEHSMRPIVNQEAWLLGILRLKILQYRRWQARQRRFLQLVSSVIAVSAPAPQEHQDTIHDLLALTAHLPSRAVMVLWLRFGLGRKPRDVARVLRCQPDSVRVLTRRALALVRRDLATGGHLPPPWRLAPVAGSLLRTAAPPRRTEPRARAGSPTAVPIALAPAVRPLRDPRRRVRRRRASRRAAPSLTPPPETRHRS